jgi:hypothetical protein
MPNLRRIVPDASVVLAARFPQTMVGRELTNVSRRAVPLLNQIGVGAAIAFAPDQLLVEVMTIAYRICTERSGAKYVGLTREHAENAVTETIKLPINYVPATTLAPIALDLVQSKRIPPPDSWYVACAIYHDAELWISHNHSDGLIERARAAFPQVHALSERSFD